MASEHRPSRRRALVLGGASRLVAAGGATLKLGPRLYNGRRLRRLRGHRVYDENADAPSLLAAALARGAREKKRVLVILGGNWCQWCLALDDLMTSDEAIRQLVAERLVLLKLDGDAASALDEAWGHPTRQGVPVLVFVDPDGKVAHVQESVSLEAWGGRVLLHDRERVLDVLRRWSAVG